MDHFKILFANISSWTATVLSMQLVKDALQIAALLGSLAVSLGSLWWIRRQAQSLDRSDHEHKPRD